LREALLYEKLEGGKVACFLCSHRCLIGNGKYGICNVRENRGGTLYTHSYGELIAQNIDPIEKNPSTTFFPAVPPTPSQPSGAIFSAPSARTGRYPRPGRRKDSASAAEKRSLLRS